MTIRFVNTLQGGASITVSVDTRRITPRVRRAVQQSIYIVSDQVMKDCNMYVPMDTGALRNSSITHSDLSNGQIRWVTPYARRLYYGVGFNFSRHLNPRAQALWAEKARSVHLREWQGVAQRAVERFL